MGRVPSSFALDGSTSGAAGTTRAARRSTVAEFDTDPVRTYHVFMSTNITLSVEERTVERAREVARRQGTSLNALIRKYIEQLAGWRREDAILGQLEDLWTDGGGRSGGSQFRRDDAYKERLGRPRVR